MATTPKAPTATVEATDLDPRKIAEHPMNPRTSNDPDEGLVASVKENGVYERLLVAPVPDDLPETARKKLKRGTEYVLVAGHRRRAAAIAAKLKTVPVDIRHDLDTTEKQLAVFAEENIHRSDLTPLEEGDLYLELQGLGLSQAQISDRTSVRKPRVSERTRVAKLPQVARDKFASGQASLDAMLLLGRIGDDPNEAARIAKEPPYIWPDRVSRVLAAKQAAREVARREKELAKAGIKVLDEFPPTPDVENDDDTAGAWWRLDDLLDVAYDGIIRAAVEHAGIEVEPGAEPGDYITEDDVEAWHQATCEGHAVVRRQIKDWMGERTIWDAICTTPATHDELLDDDLKADTGSPASAPDRDRASEPDEPAESPEYAARRAHLEQRVDAHTKWLAKLIEENPPQLHERALAEARARLPQIPLTDDGEVLDPFHTHVIDRRRTFLGMPDEASVADVEEAFRTLVDQLDIARLRLLYDLTQHGPVYGADMMREPGRFGSGWAPDRIRLLHELGWLWDDQELDEIRQHRHLATSLGLDVDDEAAAAEGEVA